LARYDFGIAISYSVNNSLPWYSNNFIQQECEAYVVTYNPI
jgi:hypothetical protein